MVEIWARLIMQKRRTIKDVPEELRGTVREYLAELGYDEEGDAL